ncbi:translocation/assembly module TamB domain-containing protein [Tateyamaria pelophila]|uniref:translocation/assembly module TamB domain-containing protein n=1 Tax=Tateyamaria pelophila TaxID=328415 RepID=UPI001CBD6C9A|nr:translocation/assembly module TamB domain-containing protein [Tateyamaria pelophila]
MRLIALVLCLIWPLSLAAQDDDEDRGFLTGLLERSLGGEGRTVRIDGFAGAFSSEATIARITIADDDGVWLTLNDVAMAWTRSALLRGRIEIDKLSASEVEVARKPLPAPGTPPAPEATPFALPELPASLVIRELNIARVALGAPVLGEALAVSLTGAAQLAGGAGDVTLQAVRIDDQEAQFNVSGSFNNETRELMLDLDLTEAEGGLLSGLMGIPDRPSLDLQVTGAGPLSNLQATLALRTDDTPRLTGTLTTVSRDDGPTNFDLDMGGDVTALFLREYAEFFGPDVKLVAQGVRQTDGALQLDDLALNTRAMNLSGQVALGPDSWPTLLDITGTIDDPDGEPVLLPGSGDPVRIDRADIRVDFDAANGDALNAQLKVLGLDTVAAKAEQLVLDLDGTLQGNVNTVGTLDARVTFDADGLDLSDPDTARAVGSSLQGSMNVDLIKDQPFRLSDIALSGADWALSGDVEVDTETGVTFQTDLNASDLSAFAGLAGVALEGGGSVGASGTASLGGFFDIQIDGETEDLAIGIAEVDTLLAGTTALDVAARRTEEGTFLDKLELRNPALSATGTATLKSDGSRAQFDAQLTDVGMISEDISGPLTIDATAAQDDGIWTIQSSLSGPLDATADVLAVLEPDRANVDLTASLADISAVVPQITGATQITANAVQSAGVWDFEASVDGPLDAAVRLDGQYAQDKLAADYSLNVPDISPLVPQVSGPLGVSGKVAQLDAGWKVDADITGPYSSTGDVALLLDAASKLSVDYNVNLPDLSPIVPQVSGPLGATGQVLQLASGWQVDADITGPYSSTADIALILDAANTIAVDYSLNVPDLSPIVPQVSGPLGVSGKVLQVATGWQVDADIAGPYSSTGDVNVTVDAQNTVSLDYRLDVPDLSPLVPQVSGPLGVGGTVEQVANGWQVAADITGPNQSTGDIDAKLENGLVGATYSFNLPNLGSIIPQAPGGAAVQGTVQQTASGFDVNANIDGPSGTQGVIAGNVGTDGLLDLAVNVQAQLGLINPFIQPRSIIGTARADLTVQGPPALTSVRGTVTVNDARVATPNLPISFNDVSGTVNLTGSQAVLSVRAGATEGGAILIDGPIGLDSSFASNLAITLDNLTVTDSQLYTTALDGDITVSGPLLNGARIGGTINVGETNVQVPSGSLSSSGPIPDITHIGATRPVMRTQKFAGLIRPPETSRAPGPVFPIDITVNAPSRIFVRGRGLDAELGGNLRLTGTTSDLISTGQFNLIRGRMDVLTERFNLTEGSISLQGRFEIFMLFVAETDTATGTATITLSGPADNPEVRFASNPEAPEDEVLAQIFFGRSVSELSAFQALQLASAIAVLAGRGGEGILSRLRGSVGLDDLDLTTDEDGATNLRAGKYLTDNIYSDVVVGGADGPEVSLNIDLTPKITVYGSFETETSNSSIGIAIRNDY